MNASLVAAAAAAVLLAGCFVGAERCGTPEGCICLWSAKTVMCNGENITALPFFESGVKKEMVTLILSHTFVTALSDLTTWQRLDTIILENNYCLNCSTLGGDDVIALGDCDVLNSAKPSLNLECRATPEVVGGDNLAYHVLSVISLFCFAILFGVKGLEKLYKKGRSGRAFVTLKNDACQEEEEEEGERIHSWRTKS